jgi:quercetin dioxygenase-like cupin family protein
MEILPKPPTTKGDPARFIGDVWLDQIVRLDPPSRIRSAIVRFSPGSRNAWHVHAVGQTLHVLDGVGRVQARGGDLLEIRAGDTILTAPGEWHWHGAAPDHFMTHLTIYEASDEGAESAWGDPVPDAEYAAEPRNRR